MLEAIDARTKVKVLVHEASFSGSRRLLYFVKVINLSLKSPCTITHVWVQDRGKEIDLVNPERILPYTLSVSEVWETWFEKDLVKDQKKVFENVRVVLSNGVVRKSKKNNCVRPFGFVAGKS